MKPRLSGLLSGIGQAHQTIGTLGLSVSRDLGLGHRARTKSNELAGPEILKLSLIAIAASRFRQTVWERSPLMRLPRGRFQTDGTRGILRKLQSRKETLKTPVATLAPLVRIWAVTWFFDPNPCPKHGQPERN
jgi:hypothetical protein